MPHRDPGNKRVFVPYPDARARFLPATRTSSPGGSFLSKKSVTRIAGRDLDRILTRLRNLIRERGYTQKEVQQALGWGRSYISQILTKQKALRVEHVLLILQVINATPKDFFGEIYPPERRRPRRPAARPVESDGIGPELRRLGLLFDGLVSVLKRRNLISDSELTEVFEKGQA